MVYTSALFVLKSVKQRMREGAINVTLYTGRIPFEATQEAYDRARLTLDPLSQFVKLQTDPQYLKNYAEYEERYMNGTFDFYDADMAAEILGKVPIEIHGETDRSLKNILRDARVSAADAHSLYLKRKPVAHIGYVLEGS